MTPNQIQPEDRVLRCRAVDGRDARSDRARLGVRAVNVYGLSEIIGPGGSGECAEERGGLHVNEDHFLPEIVDPETR